jgi:hypothetical protein
MAVQFDGGVVIGADSRTTTGRWEHAGGSVFPALTLSFFFLATWPTARATS